MARKAVQSGGKKDEIVKAALALFLERGYENTSIRMIQKAVGSEVGLFYYYFKDKDAVFEQAMNLFFEKYKKEFDEIIEQGRRNPSTLLMNFFEYMGESTGEFRASYAQKLHWTVRRAIREQTLEVIEPYLKQIIEILMSYGAKPRLDSDVAVMFLTHGVGSMILHEDREYFIKKKAEIIKGINLIMGLDPDTAEVMFPFYAQTEDIPSALALVSANGNFFPGFRQEEFEAELVKRIAKKEAFVVRLKGKVKGLILFSREQASIDFLLRDAKYPEMGIGTRLLETVLAQFPVNQEIFVITFRAGDEKGEAARKLYQKFGFWDESELEVFSYPCERMVRRG